MLPRVDRGNQHRVGKRICRALQQRCFGLVMARRLPAFDPGVRVNAGRFTYANVVIQRCAGELIARSGVSSCFLSPIHICERKPDWRLNCQRLLSSSMQKSVSLVVSCGMAWGAGECHAEVFRQTPLLPALMCPAADHVVAFGCTT